jgi:hypothetical protein
LYLENREIDRKPLDLENREIDRKGTRNTSNSLLSQSWERRAGEVRAK